MIANSLLTNILPRRGGTISLMEGKSIRIGEDCMFSSHISISNGDFHTISMSNSEDRINEARDMIIGSHVGLCEGVRILKGCYIPNNCVIGSGSLVTKYLDKSCSIYVGNPAKCVKENICWSRERYSNSQKSVFED